jgi:hypothetical protein
MAKKSPVGGQPPGLNPAMEAALSPYARSFYKAILTGYAPPEAGGKIDPASQSGPSIPRRFA